MLVILQRTKILNLAHESPLLRQQERRKCERDSKTPRDRRHWQQGAPSRTLDVLREREERQRLELGRTRIREAHAQQVNANVTLFHLIVVRV